MSMPEVQRPGHIPGLGNFNQLPSSEPIEVKRPGEKNFNFDSGIAKIRNKHNSIPRRVGFALTVLATGGLAYLFKKGVSAAALNSKFQGFLPGAYSQNRAELKKEKDEFLETKTGGLKNSARTQCYTIPTVDEGGGKLDAAIVFSNQNAAWDFKDGKLKNDYWIVKLNGNNGFYEHDMGEHDGNREAVEDTLKKGQNDARVNVVMFNYRGIGESKGSADCADDLVLDGITMCQFLLDKGIPAERILLDGMSMGGMAATKAYGFFNGQGQRVNLVRERTFGELRYAAQEVGINLIGEKLGAAAKYIFHATNWRGNAGKVLGERKKNDWGNVLELYHSEDEIMKNSSLTEAVSTHKTRGATTDDSIIQLPSRKEAAQAYFSKQDWISEEQKKKIEKRVVRIEEEIGLLEGKKAEVSDLKDLERMNKNLANLEKRLEEEEKWLSLYKDNHLFQGLDQAGKEIKSSQKENKEFYGLLVRYGNRLNGTLEDLRRSEASPLLIKRLERQQATIDWCKGIMSTHMVHNLNFSDTDTWKTGVIPKIADLFKNAAKVPVQPHDPYG